MAAEVVRAEAAPADRSAPRPRPMSASAAREKVRVASGAAAMGVLRRPVSTLWDGTSAAVASGVGGDGRRYADGASGDDVVLGHTRVARLDPWRPRVVDIMGTAPTGSAAVGGGNGGPGSSPFGCRSPASAARAAAAVDAAEQAAKGGGGGGNGDATTPARREPAMPDDIDARLAEDAGPTETAEQARERERDVHCWIAFAPHEQT